MSAPSKLCPFQVGSRKVVAVSIPEQIVMSSEEVGELISRIDLAIGPTKCAGEHCMAWDEVRDLCRLLPSREPVSL